jgi:D-3-phosphoglycerate dehydrogenase / 2-oxoglutarate reductase
MKQKKILITTVPFGENNRLPIELLESSNFDFTFNPLGRKLTAAEVCELAEGYSAIIAGTEPITSEAIARGSGLEIISRVGIGLDSVDLLAAKGNGVQVSYTPDAPAPAVAELTIGMAISLLRGIHIANIGLHEGEWRRHFGRRIPEVTIGVIGCGRIGGRVLRRLRGFGSPRILVNDLSPNPDIAPDLKIEWVDKQTIYKEADLISIHVPLTSQTRHMISEAEFAMMKKDALLINAARGGIVDEKALFEALTTGMIAGAGVDVFEDEPYAGPLSEVKNCLLTCHMGSMSQDCRARMEIEATEEVIRVLEGESPLSSVPDSEYDVQRIMRVDG